VGAPITADEIEEINDAIRELSLTDKEIGYGVEPGERVSLRRLEAIVAGVPDAPPTDQAAWLLRALVLVQPFPDANHRTGVAAAELILRRRGLRFRPSVERAATFQRVVTSARYKLLGGYDDAPLTVLSHYADPVYDACRTFIAGSSAEGTKDRP